MKSILIDERLHQMMKSYCVENGLVMKKFLQKLIIDELTKNGNRVTIVKKYPNHE